MAHIVIFYDWKAVSDGERVTLYQGAEKVAEGEWNGAFILLDEDWAEDEIPEFMLEGLESELDERFN